MAKEISIRLNRPEVSTGEIVHGRIQLNYQGRFDSLVINSQIENSDDIFRILNFNGSNVNYPYARLSIWKEEIGNEQTLDFADGFTASSYKGLLQRKVSCIDYSGA